MDSTKICSKHFIPSDFKQGLKVCRLNPDAIPSIFNAEFCNSANEDWNRVSEDDDKGAKRRGRKRKLKINTAFSSSDFPYGDEKSLETCSLNQLEDIPQALNEVNCIINPTITSQYTKNIRGKSQIVLLSAEIENLEEK